MGGRKGGKREGVGEDIYTFTAPEAEAEASPRGGLSSEARFEMVVVEGGSRGGGEEQGLRC